MDLKVQPQARGERLEPVKERRVPVPRRSQAENKPNSRLTQMSLRERQSKLTLKFLRIQHRFDNPTKENRAHHKWEEKQSPFVFN